MNKSQNLPLKICIPARLGSTRLPNKPLQKIAGRELILRVVERLIPMGIEICVVTDNEEVEKVIGQQQGVVTVIRVDDDVQSGSDRIFLAYERVLSESMTKKNVNEHEHLLLNVQGDEPLADIDDLKNLIEFSLAHPQFDVTTLVKKRSFTGAEEHELYKNPHVVKVFYSTDLGECHAFSRSPIPYRRSPSPTEAWFQHIGVYLYRANALKKFYQGKKSMIEELESLEQWRFLQQGGRIGAVPALGAWHGVDTPEDLVRVSTYFQS